MQRPKSGLTAESPTTGEIVIAVDRRALPALMARPQRLSPFQLTIETDRHGETRAFLERQAAQGGRS